MNPVHPIFEQTEAAVAELEKHPRGAQLVQGTLPQQYYAGYLTQVVQYVSQSSRFLSRAADGLTESMPYVAELLRQKAVEEAGHEKWALSDLAALGIAENVARAARIAPATAAYLGWNEFMVEHHPVAFLGTAFVLESLSSNRAELVVENLRKNATIPGIANAVSFLEKHAVADQTHVEELVSIIESITDRAAVARIVLSAQVTTTLHPGLIVPLDLLEAA